MPVYGVLTASRNRYAAPLTALAPTRMIGVEIVPTREGAEMKATVRLAAAVLLLAISSSGAALAASANAEPETQSHAHGVSSHWTLTWGGDGPFEVLWSRGDGSGLWWPSTNIMGWSDSYAFYPCSTQQFTQRLQVWDDDGGYAQDYTRATESGGSPC